MLEHVLFRLLPDARAEWFYEGRLTQGDLADLTALVKQGRNKRLVLAYPGEHVHCLSLQAPKRRRNTWLQALPYALEDQLAQDVDSLHIATAKFSSTQILPVAVVQRADLRTIIDNLAEHGLYPPLMIPDYLLLPLQPGQWTIHLDEHYARVRCSTAMGFACEIDNLPLWFNKALAETPLATRPNGLQVFGETLAWPDLAGLSITPEPYQPLLALAMLDSELNLRQGEFAVRTATTRHWQYWRPVAILAGLGLLTAGAMQTWELYRLQGERDRLQTTIEQTFRQLMPTARLVNPRAQLETLLHQAQSTRNDNEFMRLLGIAAAALQDYPALQLRRLSFRQNRLELDLRGGDLGQLDTLKTHFRQRQDIAAEINASVRDGQVLSRLSLRFAARGA